MIFSESKWEHGAEVRSFVSVAYDTEYGIFEAPLRGAWDSFIYPLLGADLSGKLVTIYGKSDASDTEKQFLYLAQRANVFLALWNSFDEMNVHITDGGMFRPDTENRKTLYKYQQQSLKDGWKNKGFNAIDELLAYLESKSETFTDFKSCPGNTLFKSSIVSNPAEVDDSYFINHSRLVFLRLLPHFRTVERTIVAPRLGTIYSDMIADLSGTAPDAKFTKLRKALIPVVVNYAVSRLIRETGSLTDRGLFFETLSGSDDMSTTSPVSDERLTMQATMAEGDAISYWKLAEVVLKSDFSYTATTTGRTPNRDNTDKKSFWA